MILFNMVPEECRLQGLAVMAKRPLEVGGPAGSEGTGAGPFMKKVRSVKESVDDDSSETHMFFSCRESADFYKIPIVSIESIPLG